MGNAIYVQINGIGDELQYLFRYIILKVTLKMKQLLNRKNVITLQTLLSLF